MENNKKRIGIMGGTFDPIHNAHVVLAKQAYHQFHLDEVWMLPNGNPPHKKNSRQADVQHRVNMIRLAIQNIPYLKLCEIECSSSTYHYTYETLQMLNERYPDNEFYFIMGADSLFDFDDWKKPDVISQECILLAATRDHCDKERMEARIQELEERYGADIRLLNTPNMDIASGDIREDIAQDEDISGMLAPAVEAYIQEHGLYQNTQEE